MSINHPKTILELLVVLAAFIMLLLGRLDSTLGLFLLICAVAIIGMV